MKWPNFCIIPTSLPINRKNKPCIPARTVALFLAFLKTLTDEYKPRINAFTQRHLDFYYQEYLQFKPKPFQADRVYLLFELSKNLKADRYFLAQGTEVTGPQDADGNDLIYTTDADLMINRAQVKAIKTVYLDKTITTLEDFAYPDQLVELFQMVYGQDDDGPKPGADLPPLQLLREDAANQIEAADPIILPTSLESLKEEIITPLWNLLTFTTQETGLRLSFYDLKRILQLKYKRESDTVSWVTIDAVFIKMNPALQGVGGENFAQKFEQASGLGPGSFYAREPYRGIQNVNNVFELHTELSLLRGKAALTNLEANRLARMEELIARFFNANSAFTDDSTSAFMELMDTYKAVRQDWLDLQTLLTDTLNSTQRTVRLDEGPTFDALWAEAYGGNPPNYEEVAAGFSASNVNINSIDAYFQALLNVEAYFGLLADELVIFFNDVLNPADEGLTQIEAQQLLLKAYRNKTRRTGIPKLTEASGLYAFPDATAATTGGADEAFPRWRTFGRMQSDQRATLGWAITSPVLRLKGGTRTIELMLRFRDLSDDQESWLENFNEERINTVFKVELSTQDKWLIPANTRLRRTESNANALTITVELPPDGTPIAPISADQPGYINGQPTLRLSLRDNRAFTILRTLQVASIALNISVTGFQPEFATNDDGTPDLNKAFLPFGNSPRVGSRFYFTDEELIVKNLDSLTISGTWVGLEDFSFGIYNKYVDENNNNRSEKTSFKGVLRLIDRRLNDIWKMIVSRMLPDTGNALEIKHELIGQYQVVPSPVTEEQVTESDRYFALELSKPDFGHRTYPESVARKARELAVALSIFNKDGVDPTPPLPDAGKYEVSPPYTPEIDQFSINYTVQIDDVRTSDEAELWHLHPFGFAPFAAPNLLPAYEKEGYLYLGLEQVNAPVDVSLLFRLAPGSADPDLDPGLRQWVYLDGDSWVAMERTTILEDQTQGLAQSGLIRLRLRALENPIHRLLPGDYYWLRLSIDENSFAIPDLIGIHTQAVGATFNNRNNDLSHLTQPLPIDSLEALRTRDPAIASIQQPYPSFGGKPVEPLERLNTRVSERLRHKNRALTVWDYEHLVLEAFPEVYKVKCIPGEQLGKADKGGLTIIVVPDIRGIRPFDPFEPKMASDQLGQIKGYLQAIAPPQAIISVENPIYIPLKVLVDIALYPEFQADQSFFEAQLDQALQRFLAPWAFAEGFDLVIGGRIEPSVIIDFIEEQFYVDYIKNLRLFYQYQNKTIPVCRRGMREGITIPDPNGIWVSDRQHRIDGNLDTLPTEGFGIGCLKVGDENKPEEIDIIIVG